jgi:hypothetical protein
MTAYTHDDLSQDAALRTLAVALQAPDYDGIRLRRIGPQLLLEGSVASYDSKCRIEKAAVETGLQVQNWLKVVPGVTFS